MKLSGVLGNLVSLFPQFFLWVEFTQSLRKSNWFYRQRISSETPETLRLSLYGPISNNLLVHFHFLRTIPGLNLSWSKPIAADSAFSAAWGSSRGFVDRIKSMNSRNQRTKFSFVGLGLSLSSMNLLVSMVTDVTNFHQLSSQLSCLEFLLPDLGHLHLHYQLAKSFQHHSLDLLLA